MNCFEKWFSLCFTPWTGSTTQARHCQEKDIVMAKHRKSKPVSLAAVGGESVVTNPENAETQSQDSAPKARVARAKFADTAVITLLVEKNPKLVRADGPSPSAQRFALYTNGMQVGEYVRLVKEGGFKGGATIAHADLRWDSDPKRKGGAFIRID